MTPGGSVAVNPGYMSISAAINILVRMTHDRHHHHLSPAILGSETWSKQTCIYVEGGDNRNQNRNGDANDQGPNGGEKGFGESPTGIGRRCSGGIIAVDRMRHTHILERLAMCPSPVDSPAIDSVLDGHSFGVDGFLAGYAF